MPLSSYHTAPSLVTSRTALSPSPAVPTCIDDLPFWCVWKTEPSANGRDAKIPYSPTTGRRAKVNDPSTFGTRADAEAALASSEYAGTGFLLDAGLGVTVIDLDDITDESAAMALVTSAETYAEWSPNGGIHLIYASTPDSRIHTATPDLCRKAEHYHRCRWMTYTGNQIADTPSTFTTNIDDLTRGLDRLAFRPRTEPSIEPLPARSSNVLTTDEIVERASTWNGEKFRRLYDGDLLDYPSPSEARYALMGILNFYTDDPAQMEDVLRQSGQWGAKCETRPDLIRTEIRKQIASYRGPRYEPSTHTPSTPPPTPPTDTWGGDSDVLSCDDARAQLRIAQAQIAQLQAQIASQARMIRFERGRLHDIETIISSPEVNVGTRVAGVGLYLELDHQEQKGTDRGERGYQIPAAWIARRTGMTTKAANGHLQKLATTGIINRTVVTLTKGEEAVDNDTGEIFTVDVPRKAGFIDTSPGAIITSFAEYKRTADAERTKHGGKRDPRPHCPNHPDAGTVTHTVVECRECGDVVWQGRTEQEPADIAGPDLAATGTDDGTPNLGSPYPPVSVSLDTPKLGSPSAAFDGSPMMGVPDQPTPPSIRPADLAARFTANGWN